MTEVSLAFVWHQHQPYYPDDVTGENPMPWVRLHGVKDYYGMALHLLEYPEMHCTINLAPSLLKQLIAWTDHGATDQFMKMSRIPTDGLKEADVLFLLDNFFLANPDQMIRPFPRYGELYQRRASGRNSAKEALRRFQPRDLRDLQVWFNLTWIHPLAFERDSSLKSLRDKGRHFTEDEKNHLLDKHVEILRQVLPLHRKLMESGQVELTTTPYYHPILPLLLDKKLAREAIPELKLPRITTGYPEDAELHVARAVAQHQQLFGQAPRGMWPAEGSVCQSMIPLLAQHGIRWIATDEGILNASAVGSATRDPRGHLLHPEKLYRPYTAREGNSELTVVFRDHTLSDQVGFHYQRSEPVAAAEEFIGRIRTVGQTVQGEKPVLVSVILDGENCWESYAGGGVAFLRALYERCCRTKGVRPVKVGEYLERHPPQDKLDRLFAGSWINHDFGIWIGHEEDNTAWDSIHRTREYLARKSQEPGNAQRDTGVIQRAWEELYIAEGSDWFWWYGEDHSSAQDELFDYLFRKHLQNVYTLLGDLPPPDLARPIKRRMHKTIHTNPRGLLEPRIDGRHTFFEWFNAGKYTCRSERGAMAQAAPGKLKELHFGFSLANLYLRVDCAGPAKTVLSGFDAVRMLFIDPPGWELIVREPGRSGQSIELSRNREPQPTEGIEVGIGTIFEIAVPFDRLGIAVEQPMQFCVELLQGRQSCERVPREDAISLIRPTKDFELIMWDV